MAILFHWDGGDRKLWSDAFAQGDCGEDIRYADSLGDKADIEYAVVWAPPPGLLAKLPNLKYIFSIGAGVTHISDDPDYDHNVPIVRLQDELLVLDMSCHIIHWVIHFHRFYARYAHQQAAKQWQRHRYPENAERRVAILGLGQTGLDACARLRDLGFPVTGWARSEKQLAGVRCLAGNDALPNVVSEADILVNLLPLTSETTNLLNADVFSAMPNGSFVINCSRGASIVDDDLLAALDNGKIEAAALDVFREEPLPEASPYWEHPNVYITPHAAAPTNERSAAKFIAQQIKVAMDGGRPSPVVDLARGY